MNEERIGGGADRGFLHQSQQPRGMGRCPDPRPRLKRTVVRHSIVNGCLVNRSVADGLEYRSSHQVAGCGRLGHDSSLLGAAQAVVGKGQNQFNYAVNLAQSQLTNLAAAESRIRDADLAAEAANLTKAQILLQAGTAAVAQANSSSQAVLALPR